MTIGGVDVRELRLEELRRGVGLVFEETFLFGGHRGGNVGFAIPDADDEEIRRAARLAGAAEFVERLPEGYETVLGERGFSLSGGQRQRIAIARAILADPQVLILDDATSAVDATKEHEIRAALSEVMAGRTTLVIAHRPGDDRARRPCRGRRTAAGSPRKGRTPSSSPARALPRLLALAQAEAA